MSRRISLMETPLVKGAHGVLLCRRCRTEVQPPRRTFCSDVCVHEWKIRSDVGYLRRTIFERDRGICVDCKVDAEALRRELQDLTEWERRDWLRKLGLPKNRVSLWDVDHVRPVCEGGGVELPSPEYLQNLVTRCIPCHALKSARDTERRTQQREEARRGKAEP